MTALPSALNDNYNALESMVSDQNNYYSKLINKKI